jgi:hypothetical protein
MNMRSWNTACAAAVAFCLSTALLVLITVPPAAAETWTGAVSGAWNNAGNWSPVGVPVSNAATQLVFGATANPVMNNDIPGTFLIHQMMFNDDSPAYSLAGNALELSSSGGMHSLIAAGTGADITINNPITIGPVNFLRVGGSGNIVLNGPITSSGSNQLNFSGPARLRWAALLILTTVRPPFPAAS